jgi:hypothetical protein
MAPVFPKAIQTEIFLNSGPFQGTSSRFSVECKLDERFALESPVEFENSRIASEVSARGGSGLVPQRHHRTFRKNAGFTVVALLSLTLGIGASIALFSAVYGVLIAPYPYTRPNQIWAPAVLGPHDAVHGWHWYSQREMKEVDQCHRWLSVKRYDAEHNY